MTETLPVAPANLLVMPAIGSVTNEDMKITFLELRNQGVLPEPLPLGDLRYLQEPHFQKGYKPDIAQCIDEGTQLMQRMNGLLVVNPAIEVVDVDDWSYSIPFSVGTVAVGMLRAANRLYGRGSGRVFLTDSYPIGTDIAYVRGTTAVNARDRISEVKKQAPVALGRDWTRAAYAAQRSASAEIATRKRRRSG